MLGNLAGLAKECWTLYEVNFRRSMVCARLWRDFRAAVVAHALRTSFKENLLDIVGRGTASGNGKSMNSGRWNLVAQDITDWDKIWTVRAGSTGI
jgi:hypothetical protein